MTIVADDGQPGMAATAFTTSNGTDARAAFADLNHIDPLALSFRLYPTNLKSPASGTGGSEVVFRAVFQDERAFEDRWNPDVRFRGWGSMSSSSMG